MKTGKVRAFKWKDFCSGHENFNFQLAIYVLRYAGIKKIRISLSVSLPLFLFLIQKAAIAISLRRNDPSHQNAINFRASFMSRAKTLV